MKRYQTQEDKIVGNFQIIEYLIHVPRSQGLQLLIHPIWWVFKGLM